jgi:two-component system, LuxR family, sensor kinase FixL
MDTAAGAGHGNSQILDRLMALSQDAIVVVRLDGMVVSWSRGAERMYGFLASEMTNRSMLAIIPNERSNEFSEMLDRIRAGGSVDDFVTVRRTKGGQYLDVLLNVTPIRDEADRIVSALMVARDLTPQRRAEAALLQSEGRWRAVIASAVDAMIVIDAKGAIEVFNPAAERLFDYSAEDMIGRNVSMLMPAPYREEHDRYIADYLRTGHQKIIGIGRQVTGRRRDGSTFPVHLSVGEMSVGGEPHFTGILHDLTPRVQLEDRMREQDTLARLGEMAAVIAHEVKNPLAAVRGAIQVVGGRLPAGSRDAPIMAEIVARIDALDDLLKDLLLFARTPQPRFTQVDLASLVQQTAGFLASDPALRELRFDVTGTLPTMIGDPELLRIVFQNLLLNAAQAMQGKGTVTVRLAPDGEIQKVTVTDRGPGMSAEARENLFRPFFTTKSRGTGLGLPTARRLIELHAGSIAVDSEPGRGTTVAVTLPASLGGSTKPDVRA